MSFTISRIRTRLQPDTMPRLMYSLMIAGLLTVQWGCSSTNHHAADAEPMMSSVIDTPVATPPPDRILTGALAREMGFRFEWQSLGDDRPLRWLDPQHDSVMSIDSHNRVARLDMRDGTRFWEMPVGKAVDEILSASYIPQVERVYVMMGGSILELDSVTGSQLKRQNIEKIANTGPAVLGKFMFYGSRNGQLIWHAYEIGYPWKAYEIGPSIQLTPVISGSTVVAVGTNGRVMALDAGSASQIWRKDLLDRVSAPPVIGDQAVYVAGEDQFLWAFDLSTGRNFWRYFTASRLTKSPVLVGDRLYQEIPSEGLVCFNAVPIAAPGGEKLWSAEGQRGSVVTSSGKRVLVWDPVGRVITVLDAKSGAKVDEFPLPNVVDVKGSKSMDGDLYLTDELGRIARLVPRGGRS